MVLQTANGNIGSQDKQQRTAGSSKRKRKQAEVKEGDKLTGQLTCGDSPSLPLNPASLNLTPLAPPTSLLNLNECYKNIRKQLTSEETERDFRQHVVEEVRVAKAHEAVKCTPEGAATEERRLKSSKTTDSSVFLESPIMSMREEQQHVCFIVSAKVTGYFIIFCIQFIAFFLCYSPL